MLISSQGFSDLWLKKGIIIWTTLTAPIILIEQCFPFEMQMGIADAILDLVSSGTTLRENNLKEIEGGVVLESQVNF